MRIKPFFPVFVVLVGVVAYAYYVPTKRPEKGFTVTPKQYMEIVEKNKAAKPIEQTPEIVDQAAN
ncbi:MAG: hypothetical protein KDI63_10395 [Gammaproteobacteria bacterium]|nr:hypothetical protein [Gammaproteobacteria bacterium]